MFCFVFKTRKPPNFLLNFSQKMEFEADVIEDVKTTADSVFSRGLPNINDKTTTVLISVFAIIKNIYVKIIYINYIETLISQYPRLNVP